MRYLLTITYYGKDFFGWQKQKNKRTIQEEIEKGLEILLKENIDLVGSGRTDSGVNAYKQKAHFDCNTIIDNYSKFLYSLNGILSDDVKVLSIEETDVHARFSAKNKTYLYKMYKSNYELPLNFGTLRIDEKINLDIMQKCASLLVGEHDFSALACKGSEVMSTIRTIYSADFKIMGDNVEFYITGNGFLYKMVRNIMGVLLEVGKGKLSEDEFKQIVFEGKKHSNKTAPACALYLYDVVY